MEGTKIYPAMVAIMKDIDAITKDRKNTSQGYTFRGIDDVYNSLHPILAKHGVFCTAQIEGEPKREDKETKNGGALIYTIINYKISFVADDGSSVSSIIRGEGMDSGDKSSNKALSAAMKYACMLMFLIPTEDIEDADSESPETKGKTAPAKPASSAPNMAKGSLLFQAFKKACIKAGYKTDTKEGQADIKAWLKKAGKTEMKFDELSPEKQGDLINMMKAQELPK